MALILETAVAPRRRMLDGVARYIREHDPWALYLKPAFADHELQDWLKNWDGDGVITVVKGAQKPLEIVPAGISLVYCGGMASSGHLPIVLADNDSIGRLGAQHLMERGFRHFAFVRYEDTAWSTERGEAFAANIQAGGFHCVFYDLPAPELDLRGPSQWEVRQRQMVSWIASLPTPIGIMTTTDMLGHQVLEACQRASVSVPEQVAVLGADDDETICRLSNPPMSSVIIDDMQRGYQAASVLDRMMSGGGAPKEPIYIPARGVMARGSTDIMAIDDPAVVLALRFFRENACSSISVDDVVSKVNVCRRVLERRFRRHVGRSMNEQLVQFRIDHAVELLTNTELQVKQIATKSGFGCASYMGTVFQRVLKRTPGSYRPMKPLETPPRGAMPILVHNEEGAR